MIVKRVSGLALSWPWRVRPRNAVVPALQVSKRTADARSVVAEFAKASVAVVAQPAAEPPGHMAVIQHSGSFFAAEIACGSWRTDALGELIPLAGCGALAHAAGVHAIGLSSGPSGHSKVTLFAMLAAPFAAAFGCIPRREPCCLLGEPLALQEA